MTTPSNYSELQTEIAAWLHRSDLNTRIPSFIKMGEGYLNNNLRLMDMEDEETTSMSTSSRYLSLPERYQEMVDLWITDVPVTQMKFLPASQFSASVTDLSTTGKPYFFTIRDQIEFNYVPDSDYPLRMHFLKGYDIASTNTNWLLTNHPDLYIDSAMIHALKFKKEYDQIQGLQQNLQSRIKDLNRIDARKRGSNKALLRMDSGYPVKSTYNINTGY